MKVETRNRTRTVLAAALAVLSLVFALPSSGAENSPSSKFAEANAHFDAGKFPEAAEAYRALHNNGVHSPELYYNLGLAEQHNGSIGAAVLSFERTLMLDPSYEPARTALHDLATTNNLQLPENNWLGHAVAAAGSRTFWVAGGALAWIGAFLVLTGVFVARNRRLTLTAGVVVLTCGAGLLGAATIGDPLLADRGLAVVTAEQAVSGLSQPVDNADRITDLAPGTTTEILSTRGRWTYCALGDGRRVWIPADSVSSVIPEAGRAP